MVDREGFEYAEGTISRVGPGVNFFVRLEDGQEVLCRVSPRRHPWGDVIGRRVRIQFRPIRKEKSPLIVKWYPDESIDN